MSAPDCELGSLALDCADHDASPKPRAKDKRSLRPVHSNKCKAQRERRKLREKRRSTGVVHLQSTESTGGSTGEEEDGGGELVSAETRRNTALNEGPLSMLMHQQPPGGATTTAQSSTAGNHDPPRPFGKPYKCRKNKSPSDLDADDEDNQEYDSGAARADVLTGDSNHSTTPPLPPVGDWPINGSLHRALGEAERVQEEVRRLVQLLKEKELRIHSLERRVLSLAKELSEVTAENQELRAMNNALLDGVPLAMQPPSKE